MHCNMHIPHIKKHCLECTSNWISGQNVSGWILSSNLNTKIDIRLPSIRLFSSEQN